MKISAPKVNLIWLGEKSWAPHWELGDVLPIKHALSELINTLRSELANSGTEAWLIWDGSIELPSKSTVLKLLQEPVDVWHIGLDEGLSGQPEVLKYVAPAWLFGVDPNPSLEAISWRLSLKNCLIRSRVIRQLGLPSPDFKSLTMAGLELGFRYIKGGAVLKHNPWLSSQKIKGSVIKFDYSEQLIFISHSFGKKWASWVMLNTFLQNPLSTLKNHNILTAVNDKVEFVPLDHKIPPIDIHQSVSIILPTLKRYDYLPGCLQSLREQSWQADEIIVIDQNSKGERRPDIYIHFDDLPLRVIWQDKRGQSTARNRALKEAAGDWIFFVDDDSVYPPDAIQSHLSIVNHFSADGVTGVSIPPRAYQVPKEYRHTRLAHNLDTGNCLLRKSAVLEAGGFDHQYDFGKGADQDLGMRIYKNGGVIIHNPYIQRVHYKAQGGLRDFGVLWDNRSIGLTSPRPPVTITYYYLRYFPEKLIFRLLLNSLLFSSMPSSQVLENRTWKIMLGFIQSLIRLPFMVIPAARSFIGAKKMIKEGPKFLSQ